MSAKPESKLAREFQQTAALAKKLVKPLAVTLHVPQSVREGYQKQADEMGITLDQLLSLLVSINLTIGGEQVDWALGNFRDDVAPED